MAGSISASYQQYNYGQTTPKKLVKVITIDWTADAADASIPALSIELEGWLVKAITNPGATAPTDNYDITLGDPADSALDALGGALMNRDTANSEQVYPVASGATTPIFLCGTYSLAVAGNAVNSATGQIVLYVLDEL